MPPLLDAVNEFMLLFPDSLLFGSLIFGIITISFVHSILFVSIIESLVILYGLQGLFSFLVGKSNIVEKCTSKVHTIIFQDLFVGTSSNNPSYSTYLVGMVSSYVLSSLYYLNDELEILDSSFIKQYNMSLFLLIALPIAYSIFRMVNACDTLSSTFLGLFFGLLVGLVLCYQNSQIFGRESINFLGIPLLRSKTANNEPLYICTKNIGE
jgi:hypothetical protein